MEFKLGSDDEKQEEDIKITILEPQQIIELLVLLDCKDEESKKKVEKLKTPLTLIRNEMGLCECSNLNLVRQNIEETFSKLQNLASSDQTEEQRSSTSEMQLVHHGFTDKLICVKDSYYIKQIHRDSQTDQFEIGQPTCFSEPPRTLDSRVTLQVLRSHLTSMLKFISWHSMLSENLSHPHYLGIIKQVFDDLRKSSKIVGQMSSSFVQFSVKLFDMKFFLDSAILHTKSAIRRQT